MELGLPRGFLRACILLMLREKPRYGYGMRAEVGAMLNVGRLSGDGGIYRLLQIMEEKGLVKSYWTATANGPRRRMYELTPAGATQLTADIDRLRALRELLDRIIEGHDQPTEGTTT